MSDVSQGPGWWQASDGKWYPPESAPGGQAAAPQPTGAPQPQGFGAPQQQGFGAPQQQGFGAPAGGVNPAAAITGPGGQPLATWAERVVGFLIEWAPIAVLAIVFGFISTWIGLVFWVIEIGWWIYNGSLNGTHGQSIGKKVTGLRVVSEETGQPLGSSSAGILRSLYHIVDTFICYIGWLFPLWDAKRQTIADKIAKTVVLSGQQKHEINADLLKD